MVRSRRWSAFILGLILMAQSVAYAGNSVPLFLPFQGRATDNAGQPINTAATFKFRIYPAAGTCYIYEDTQSITPNGYGFFSVILGGLANRTGPANNFADVFSNDATVTDSCAMPYTGTANEWRRLEVVVDGVPLPTMQTIAASAFSINSNMLDGKTSAQYLQVNGNVTQANMVTLTGAGDASALHHHDSRYVTLSGNNAISGNITSSGSFYGVGAGSTIGIGTSSPIADIEVRRTSPSLLLGATSGGGGTASVTFTSGATQRAKIQASETTNELRFFTGSTEAMRLDASQNLILTGSLQVGGTVGLGKYNNAQETTLITTLTGMGAAGVGTMWVNSQTNTFKFWDGTQAIGLGSSSYITSVTAGTGLTDSGTATAPILNVAYGSTAGTAIQGNASFGGDVTGGYTNLVVTQLQGRPVDSTAPTSGQVLTWNTSVNRWLAQAITDTQLSSNVALKNAANVFTNTNTIQVATATNTGLVLQTTDNSTTNNILSIRNSTATPIVTVRADGVPTATTDLTTKSYVDTQDATKLSLSGGTMSGALNMGANQITNMADPSANQHAATKFYTDTHLGTRSLATTAPGANQILKWNGSQWEPAADVDTGITALTGDVSASGNGSVVATIATGAVDSAKILDGTIATVDIGNLQVTDAKISGVSVSKIASGAGAYFTYAPNNSACSTNEILKWNGSAWICGTDNNAGGDITEVQTTSPLLGGGSSGGLTLSIDVGTTANKVLQLNGSAQIPAVDGSLLTFVNAATLRGVNLSGLAPSSGQVLKFNGSAWEASADTDTGITALSGDVTASGSGSVAATIRDDRIVTSMIKSTGGGTNRLLITDSTTGGTITFADTCAAGDVLKWTAGTGWGCAPDVGAAGVVTLVSGGTGTTGGNIISTGTINVDVGTTANKILQLNGSAQIPAVDGSLLTFINAATLRGVNLSGLAPSSGQVLKFNGSAWEAAADNNAGGDITEVQTTSPLLGGGSAGGLTLSIDVGTTANKVLQLNGSAQIPAVDGSLLTFINAANLRGVNLSGAAPTSGQVLKYNGSAWEAAADDNDGGDITSVNAGTGLLGGAAFGDATLSVDVGTTANKILQLNGSAQIPAVDGSLLTFINAASLRGRNLSSLAPTSGQVLTWNGSAWEAATDGGGDITQVSTTSPLLGGGSAGGLTLSIDVGTTANKVLQLNGSAQIPAVDGSLLTFINAATLRGVNLSGLAPSSGQVLKFNGSAWEAAADTDTGITALSGDVTASGSGSVAATIRDDRIVTSMIKSTGGGTNRLLITDSTTGGTITFADTCAAGDVLKWTAGTGWGCAPDVGAAGVVTLVAGGTGTTGGNISSTGTINVDVGTTANKILQLNGSAQIPAVDGSLLTNINAATLRGVNLSGLAPSSGQVLKFNGSAWEAAADTDSGGDITEVSTTSPLLGGGSSGGLTLSIDTGTTANKILQLNGSAQIPAVDGSLLTNINAANLRGVNIAGTAPTSGYVLTYNGSAWEPAPAAATGVTLVSGGSGLTGGNISDTGTLAVDTGTTANKILQLNGSAQIPAVDGSLLTNINAANLRGVNLSGTVPTSGQVLKYNGSAWEAAADTDSGGDITEVQTTSPLLGGGSSGGLTLSIDTGTTANKILQLNGSAQIPAVDGSLLTDINAANLRGVNLSGTVPTSGQVLKYNGSAWEAAADTDSGITALSGDVTASGSGSVAATIRDDRIVTSMIKSTGGGTNRLLITDSATGATITFADTCNPNEVLKWSAGTGWGCGTVAASGVTLVSPGNGLVAGNITGTGTIDVDTGTTANKILQLNGSAQIPAVDGSLLTNINAATLRGVNLSGLAPSSGQVLKFNGSAWEAAADADSGGDITEVSTTSPLLGGGSSGGLTLSIDTGTTANKILQLNGSAQIPAVDGSLLTNISTASIRGTNVSGTAPTTSGQILAYNGSAWAPSTATYPLTTTINRILYSSAANTVGEITTGNTGALVTSNTGVPSITTGAANTVLRSNGTTVSFAQVDPTTDISQGSGGLTISSANAGTSIFGNNSGAATTTVRSGTGGLTLTSTGTSVTAVSMTATGAGGGVTISSAAAGAFAINGGTGANSIITSTRNAAGALTLRTTGGGSATTLITSNGTSNSAVNITATGAAGGITLTPTPSGNNGHTVISAGRLGIGSTTPAYTLDVVGSGQFTSSVYASAFFYTSDARLKENFSRVPGLEALSRISGYRFNWKKDHSPEIGLIAQEVEQVFPELVSTNSSGYKTVKYGNLVAPLVEASKELYGMCKANEAQMRSIASTVDYNARMTNAQLQSMQNEIEKLKAENKALHSEIQEIKALLKK